MSNDGSDNLPLRTMLERVRFRPDPEDLRRRLKRRAVRQRLIAGGLGLALGAAGILVAVVSIGPADRASPTGPRFLRETTPPPGSVDTQPMDDQLLVGQSSAVIVTPEGERESSVASEVSPHALSPGGGTVLATRGRHEPTGVFRELEVLLVDVRSGRVSVVAEAGAKETFYGPFEWSSNGTRLGYVRALWTLDPAKQHPGEPVSLSPCSLEVATNLERCLPPVELESTMDFSPDGTRVLIAGGYDEPIRASSFETRATIEVVPANGGPGVSEAVRQAGLGSGSIQFADPTWSESERFVAVLASAEGAAGYVPLIFEGRRLVAAGQPNPDYLDLAWSPTADVLAYSMGRIGVPQQGDPPHGVRLLEPATGEDMPVLTTSDIPNVPGQTGPFVIDLVWSPSGQWIAAGGRDQIWIVDPARRTAVKTIDKSGLVDWEGLED